MLRRKAPDVFELRMIEAALARRAPAALSDERKLLLLNRVMQSLGEQDLTLAARVSAVAQTRWVVVPAGAGLAAAIALAVAGQLELPRGPGSQRGSVVGQLRFEGSGGMIDSGELVFASEHSWITYGNDVQVGLEQGSAIRLRADTEAVHVELVSGDGTFSSTGKTVRVYGANWHASVVNGGVARLSLVNGVLSIEAFSAGVELYANGTIYDIAPGSGPFTVPPAGIDGTGMPDPPSAPPAAEVSPPARATDGAEPPPGRDAGGPGPGGGHGASSGNGNGAAGGNPPENPPQPPGNAYGHDTPPGNNGQDGGPPAGSGGATPPETPGQGVPPEEPGKPGDPGTGAPPEVPADSGGTGNGPPEDQGTSGQGTLPENPNSGHGTPPEDSNGNNNGTPPQEPGDRGNGGPPEDPGSNGNGTPPEDPGSNGNGTPPEDPGSNGNGGPPENPGGNGNGQGNSGGNGSGNGNP